VLEMSTNLPSKYDHFQLGREFRDFVKPQIKALPGWQDYYLAQGWKGRTQGLDRAEIIWAAEALGFDLMAAHAQWLALGSPGRVAPPVTLPSPSLVASQWNNPPQHGALPSPDAMSPQAREPYFSLPGDAPQTEAESMTHVNPVHNDAERYEGGDVDVVIGEILAPASPHMTPHLAAMMPGLIRDAVSAAVRGPRTVVKTIVQPVASDGALVAPPMLVSTVKSVPVWQAFGGRKGDAKNEHRHVWQNLLVDICDHSDPLNEIDLDYLWQPSLAAELAAQDAAGMNGWVYGVAGTGKSVGLAQYAARLGRPFIRIPIERTTEPNELIGMMVPSAKGGMTWEDGKLTRAFRVPRAVILIDEPSLLRSGTLSVIGTALDSRKIHLVTGEVVCAAPGVFICAADNTNGCGDDTGRYVDTAALNAAFMDRFALRTELNFLTPSQETTMVARRVGVHAAAIKPIVDYATLTRRDCDAGKLTMGVTTRRLLAWGHLVRIGITSKQAFEGAVIQACAAEDKAALITLASASLTSAHAYIDGVVRGSIDPNAPAIDPKAQGGIGAAGNSFPNEGDPLDA
jgi:cobaltochelatase CobS